MKDSSESVWVVGVTGASGQRYAARLIDVLSETIGEVHVVFSEAAFRVLREEEDVKCSPSSLSTETLFGMKRSNVFFYDCRDIAARVASGSFRFDGMTIIPCSMSTLGAIANGIQYNLIHRAAEVTMKEGRKLVVVPRETPLSPIHLENMLKLSKCGVSMVPAMPGFYHRPKAITDLIDMLVMKVLDTMGIESSLVKRWREEGKED